MNIDRPALTPLPPSGGTAAPPAATTATRTRPAEAAPTAAHGSATAQLRSTHGDFDAARVNELRERIQNGSYAVNLGKVADGLLNHLNDIAPRT
jgi:negative regulator of flagellin synthesis FlgM